MTTECTTHDWQPVEKMRAVYRCPHCGAFGFKPKIRTGITAGHNIQPYRCHHTGCNERVVIIYPIVRAVKRHQPSCSIHRKDKQ